MTPAGAERADIEAPIGHESIATTQIDTNVGQARMEQVVARLGASMPRPNGRVTIRHLKAKC